MRAVYRWVEHTAELELRVEAPSEAAVFAEALIAFAELAASDGGGEAAERTVELEAVDAPALLVDWLNELVYLAEVERFVPERVLELALADGRLRARVAGRLGEPRHLVKAVTLHGAALAPDGAGTWHARLVLDV